MTNTRTNILICGTFRSGSHALVDLFSEYDNIGIYPVEFDEFRAPGMVADQLDEEMKLDWPSHISKTLYLPKLKSRIAEQLLSSSILQKKALRKLLNNFEPIRKRVISFEKRRKLLALDHLLKTSVSQEEKLKATRDWIQNIGEIHTFGDSRFSFFLFDQPLTLSTNIEIVKKVFEPFKMICSLRNPKDQMANLTRDRFIFRPYGAPRINWGLMMLESKYSRKRLGAFKMFVDDITKRYERIKIIEDALGPDNFKVVSFESLVNDYDNSVADLERFVGLQSKHHINQKKYFNPEISAKNIGYHSQYLKPEEYAMLKDLERMYDDRFPAKQ